MIPDRPSLSERLGPYYTYFLLAPLMVMLIGFFAVPLLWLFLKIGAGQLVVFRSAGMDSDIFKPVA